MVCAILGTISILGRPCAVALAHGSASASKTKITVWNRSGRRHIAITPSYAEPLTDDRIVFRTGSRWMVFQFPLRGMPLDCSRV